MKNEDDGDIMLCADGVTRLIRFVKPCGQSSRTVESMGNHRGPHSMRTPRQPKFKK